MAVQMMVRRSNTVRMNGITQDGCRWTQVFPRGEVPQDRKIQADLARWRCVLHQATTLEEIHGKPREEALRLAIKLVCSASR